MEDKYTDKHTVDQAWDMMHATLDKVMPVQKKRRALWWIPVFAGLLLMGTWYYMSSSTEVKLLPENKVPTEKVEKIIASSEKKSSADKKDRDIKLTNLNTTQQKNENEISKVKQRVQSNKEAKAKTKTIAKADVKKIEQEEKTVVSYGINQVFSPVQEEREKKLHSSKILPSAVNEQVTETKKSSAKEIEATESVVTTVTSKFVERPELYIAQSLPSLSRSLIDLESSTPVLPAIVVEKNSKWNFETRIAYLNDLKFASSTFMTEARLTRKLSPRWNLISGLGWKNQTFDISRAYENFDIEREVSSNLISADTFGFTSDMINESDNSKIKNNYLYFSMGARYQLGKNWEVEGGLNYNFLNIGKLDSFYNERTRFAFYTSIDYHLFKNLAVFAQYQNNSMNFKKSELLIDTHQFGVGTRYLF